MVLIIYIMDFKKAFEFLREKNGFKFVISSILTINVSTILYYDVEMKKIQNISGDVKL